MKRYDDRLESVMCDNYNIGHAVLVIGGNGDLVNTSADTNWLAVAGSSW